MSSVPAGKRDWKCPECGAEVQLSVTQLDPIACDACLAKMKSSQASTTAGTVAGPLGIWAALPEMTKLGIAIGGLLVGLLIGFMAGQTMALQAVGARNDSSHAKSSAHSKEIVTGEESPTDDAKTRPDPPGPGYKWMPGRKHKDGTLGSGYWAKDPHYKGNDESSKKKSSK